VDGGGTADHALEVDEAEALADVVADDHQVRAKEFPALGAGRVVELETVLSSAGANLKDEGLVHVPEQGDVGLALEVLAPLADAPFKVSAGCQRCQPMLHAAIRLVAAGDTDDKKVDFPHLSSPSSRIVMVCSSMMESGIWNWHRERRRETSRWPSHGLILGSGDLHTAVLVHVLSISRASYRPCQERAPHIILGGSGGVASQKKNHLHFAPRFAATERSEKRSKKSKREVETRRTQTRVRGNQIGPQKSPC